MLLRFLNLDVLGRCRMTAAKEERIGRRDALNGKWSAISVPLGSFILAVLLSILTGSRDVSARRQSSQPTGPCTHTFAKKRTPPSCLAFETGPQGGLEESDCDFRPPTDQPEVNREIRLVQLVENDTQTPAGDPVDESEANTSAGGRDGGLVLLLGGHHDVTKTLTRVTGDSSCCHVINIGCTMTISSAVGLDDPVVRGNTAFGVATSRGSAQLQPDCGAAGSTTVAEVTVVASRRRLLSGVLVDNAFFVSSQNGAVSTGPLQFPDPNLGGVATKALTPQITPPAGAGVSAIATARYQGDHRVSVQAALVQNKTGTARGRTRLKFLTLFDPFEPVGESDPNP
jgi:hypothetical protein